MKNKTNLKEYRRETPLLQQDIAFLLNMDNGRYCRIEKGKRPPTLDVILIFHILSGTKISIFNNDYQSLEKQIITRSLELVEQLKTEQHPNRTDNRIAYLEQLVKDMEKKYE